MYRTMSSEAHVPEVEMVTVPLSEKGLTDLAAMLVKSGRLSAASFREWSNRTQQIAGRWVTKGKTGKEPKKPKGSGNSTNPGKTTDPKRKGKDQVKDTERFRILKKIYPECKLGNWGEVMNLTSAKAMELQIKLLEKRQEFLDAGGIRFGLESLGLNEEEIKLSRSVFPYLPKYQTVESRQDLAGAVPPTGTGNTGPVAATDNIGGDGKAVDASYQKVATGTPTGGGAKPPPVPVPQPPGGKTTGTFDDPKIADCVIGKDAQELAVIYSQYNWDLKPTKFTAGFVKFMNPAYACIGVSKSKWKGTPVNSKFELLAKKYG
jgi:hypothetical protein